MNIKNISFIDYCYEIHRELSTNKSNAIPEAKSLPFSFFSKISEEKLQKIYKENIDHTINKYIVDIGEELEAYRKLDDINFYENSISLYLALIVLWCIDKKVNLSRESLNKICHYSFLGTIGYRIIDLHQDHSLLENKSIYLALYLINISEELLTEIFPSRDTLPIIKKYSNLYNKTEYKEKQNRWNSCPFSWKNANDV